MNSYFAYIRVSTVRQGEHGSSLQEQRAAIESFAQRAGLRITAWFEEMETAAKRGRGAFNRMLADLECNKARGVIIHKIDRSARNLRDWARLGELIDLGVEVHFVTDNLDMSTRGGRLSADIQAVVAADYIRNLREEVRKGFYGRLKQGFYPLPAPYGYADRGKAQAKEIDPIKGPLIAQAFALYATATYSIDMLRKEMAARGMVAKSGRPVSRSNLATLLHNPFYIGLMRIRTSGEVFQGNHQPLVSKAVFDRVQSILSGRLYPRTQVHQYRFRRLLKCGTCARSLTGERQKGRVYYRCHSYSCRGTSVSEAAVDLAVQTELRLLAMGEEDVRDFREIVEELDAEEAGSEETIAVALRRELALVEERINLATDAVIDGTIDKASYQERRSALLERRAELRDGIETAQNSTFWQPVAERFELGFTAQLAYKNGNDTEKRELLQSIVSNLTVQQKTIEIAMSSPFAELREWAKSQNGGPSCRAARTFMRGTNKDDGAEELVLVRRRRPRAKAFFKRLAQRIAAGTTASPPTP